MKKKMLFLAAFSGMFSLSNAQVIGAKQVVEFSSNYDTPHEIAKYVLHFQPLAVQVNDWNIAFGSGAQFVYRPTETLSFDAFGSIAWADRMGEDRSPYSSAPMTKPLAFCKSGTHAASELGITTAYYFKNEETEKNGYLHLNQKHSSDHRIIAVLPCKAIVRYGIRLGYWYTSSFYKRIGTNFVATLADTRTGGPIPPPPGFTDDGQHVTTMYQQGLIRIGFERLLDENFSAHFKDWPDKNGNMNRNVRLVKRLYADVLLGVKQNLVNVMVPTQMDANGVSCDFREYELNKNTSKSMIGLVVGYSMTFTHKLSWFCGLEGGLMPGPGGLTSNTFLNLKANISISSNKPRKL